MSISLEDFERAVQEKIARRDKQDLLATRNTALNKAIEYHVMISSDRIPTDVSTVLHTAQLIFDWLTDAQTSK